MGRLKMNLYLLICLFVILNIPATLQVERVAVDELREKFLSVNNEIWNMIEEEHRNEVSHSVSSRKTLEKYTECSEQLQRLMPNHISDGLQILDTFRPWVSLYSEMRQIYTLYENFKMILTQENHVPSPKEQWLEFAQTVTSDFGNYKYLKQTLPVTMRKIRSFVNEQNIFNNVLHYIVYEYCELGQSTDQILYNLYNSIALIQLKGFEMIEFAYTMLSVYGKAYKINDHQQMLKEYIEAYQETTEKAIEAMKSADRDIWKCDPKKYVSGETYTELTQLLQGYLENEVDMNERSNCLQNCAYYSYTSNKGCYQGICKHQRVCKGKILECKYIASDMTVCEADKKSGKRYDYIEYDNDRVFGRNTGCSRGTTRVESWWRWLFWHCSYCICLCDEESSTSDRYFSLRPVVSDISKNMVVTGLRFRKVNRVIHLQIQQAELLPYGNVNVSSQNWKKIDSFRITDRYVRNTVDYHTMSWEKRDLDLDDLIVPRGYVVTGARFRVIGAHLNLEVQGTPFNFTSGTLRQTGDKSFWHSSDNTLTRKHLTLSNPDVPTRTQLPSQPDSSSDMYLEFSNTDLEKDVGQRTVPFIDIQDVTSVNPIALSGIGIYHKGQPNFGGFVAPKIMTYHFKEHMIH